MDLPFPHIKKVAPFAKIAGVENSYNLKKSGKYITGCYRIWGLNKRSDFCYIGQAKHLGIRVKFHVKRQNKNTWSFCKILGNKDKVYLFILSNKNKIISDLMVEEIKNYVFLSLLGLSNRRGKKLKLLILLVMKLICIDLKKKQLEN